MTTKDILIVEDELIIAVDIRRMLLKNGYTVLDICRSGEKALKWAAKKPDLVLMDIRLDGEMDGIATAKEFERLSGTPVVYMSSHTDPHTVEAAKATNPYGYVVKPLVERDMCIAIEMALARYELQRELENRDRWMQCVINCMGESLIATDHEGRVTLFNRGAEELLRRPAEDVIGQPLDKVLRLKNFDTTPRSTDPFWSVMGRVEETDWTGEAHLLVRMEMIAVDYTATLVEDADARILGSVITLRRHAPTAAES